MINYARILPACLGPKLSYHGFKYDEEYSYGPEGDFFFSRSYWCVTQRVSVGPVDYNFEEAKAVIARGEDFPTEVPSELLLIRERGFRLWLSNRYITAILHNDRQSVALIPNVGIVTAHDHPVAHQTVGRWRPPEPGSRLPTWWEFHGEDDLRRTLKAIVAIIESQGLDWFEEQVADTKRYHEKLERRRQNAKNRSPA